MSGDPKNSRVWLLGDTHVGDTDAAPPTAPTGAMTGFSPLGCLTTDGLTRSREADSTDLPLWGKGVARVIKSNEKRTFKVAATDDNPVLFQLVEPNSTQESAAGVTTRTVKASSAVSNPKSFVFETADGSIHRRIYVPIGEVTEVADIVASEEDWEAKELTITAYPDADGTLYIEITDDPQAVVAEPIEPEDPEDP